MVNSILISTALLTALLAVGLVFFIRASTKDRIQIAKLLSTQPEPSLLEQLQQYFTQRAYRLTAVDAATQQITFEGFVQPSVFLAVFLTVLAAVGTLCLSLVLSMALPSWGQIFPALVLLSPLAGVFYWRKSARPEKVLLRVETVSEPSAENNAENRSVLTVTAHRDELAELQRTLRLQTLETE
jgi:Cofactor assembly of complex C subunit B